MHSYTYQVYGLIIDSDRPLPLLQTSSGNPDTTVYTVTSIPPLTDVVFENPIFQLSQDRIRYHIAGIATYLIEKCGRIGVLPETDEDIAINLFLLDVPLISLLYWRGYFVLRGGAAMMDGRAFMITGSPGAGKSMLLTMLHQQGYPVICDGLLVFDEMNGVIHIQPGYPELHLLGLGIYLLGMNPKAYQKVRPVLYQRRYPLGKQFHEAATPVGDMYIMLLYNDINIQHEVYMGTRKLGLIRHFVPYVAIYEQLVDPQKHFALLVKLLSQINVEQVRFTHTNELITTLRDKILSDYNA